MAVCLLTGTWVAPDLTPREGRVIATVDDPNRVGNGVVGGSSVGFLSGGTLPTSGPDSLRVATPNDGRISYTIRERLTGVDEQTYKITVLPGDTTIDLSTRPS